MSDTYRDHLLQRVLGGTGRPAVGPVADTAGNAAREAAAKIAVALRSNRDTTGTLDTGQSVIGPPTVSGRPLAGSIGSGSIAGGRPTVASANVGGNTGARETAAKIAVAMNTPEGPGTAEALQPIAYNALFNAQFNRDFNDRYNASQPQPVNTPGAVPVTLEEAAAGVHPGVDPRIIQRLQGNQLDVVPPTYNVSGAPGENRAGQPPVQPESTTPGEIPGSTQFQLGGSSDDLMTVPSGGYESLPVDPTIVREAAVPGATTPVEGPHSDVGFLDFLYHGTTEGIVDIAQAVQESPVGRGLGRILTADVPLPAIPVPGMRGSARPVDVGDPSIADVVDLYSKGYEANARNVAENMYTVAKTGVEPTPDNTLNPMDWYYFTKARYRIWSTDPANKDKIVGLYETGLDINEDGVIDVKGADAVWLVYTAENEENFFVDLISSMGLDPLFAVSLMAPAAGAGRAGAQAAEELAIIGQLPRAARVARAVDRMLSGVTKAGEIGNTIADLPFRVPLAGVELAGKGLARIPGAGPGLARRAGWLFQPSERTRIEMAGNENRDLAESVLTGSQPPGPVRYPSTPGVTEGTNTPYGGEAFPGRPPAIDPATGAPVGTVLTDLPTPPAQTPGPLPGGPVGVGEGRIAPEPIVPEPPQPPVLKPLSTFQVEEAGNLARYGGESSTVKDVVPASADPAVVAVRKSTPKGVATTDIGLNGDVRVVARNNGVWEVQTKNASGRWVGKKGFQDETEAIAYGKGIVNGSVVPPATADTAVVPTAKPKIKKTPVSPEQQVRFEVVPASVESVDVPARATPGWVLKAKPGGMIEAAERLYPEQWAQARAAISERAAIYEHAVDLKRTDPLPDTRLRPGGSSVNFADQAIHKAEFYADMRAAMEQAGIPVGELPNVPRAGIKGSQTEQWVRDAIYGEEATSKGSRNNLYANGYMLSKAPSADLAERILNADLKPTTANGVRHPDGSITIDGVQYSNNGLRALTPEMRQDLANRAVENQLLRYERGQRLAAVRSRLQPGGAVPGSGMVLQDTIGALNEGYQSATDKLYRTIIGDPVAPKLPGADVADRPLSAHYREQQTDEINRVVQWGGVDAEQASSLRKVLSDDENGVRTYWDVLSDVIDKHIKTLPADPTAKVWTAGTHESAVWRRGVANEFAETIKALTGKPVPPAMHRTMLNKILSGVMSRAGQINRISRQGLLYNVLTGPRGWAQDVMSTGIKMVWEGHTAAAAQSLFPNQWFKVLNGDLDALDLFAARYGMDVPHELHISGKFDESAESARSELNVAISDTLGLQPGSAGDRTVAVMTAPASSRFLAKGRAASDNLTRRAVFLDTAESLTAATARDFRRLVRKWGDERGIVQSSTDAYMWELGDQFTPADLGRTLRELGADAGLERTAVNEFADLAVEQWRTAVNGVRKQALAETKRVLFSYEKTNLDDFLGNFIFFHYWMSRSLPSYLRLGLHNPELAALWFRAWNETAEKAEEAGYPKSLVGYLRFMGNSTTGWSHYYNPLQFFIPFDVLRQDPYADTTYETLAQFAAISPVVQAVFAIAGVTNQAPDMIGLYSVRKGSMALLNELRAHGWIGDVSLQDDWYEQATTASFEFVNEQMTFLPFVNDRTFNVRNVYNAEVIDYMMRDLIAEQTGVPYDGTNPLWQPGGQYFETWAEAKRDLISGDDNPIVKKAYGQWAAQMGKDVGWNVVLPGGVRSRYNPRDQDIALTSAGYAALDVGQEPTPEQQGAMDFRSLAKAGSPEDFALTTELMQLDKIGTENGRQGYKLWNEIAYGDIKNDEFLFLHGEVISGLDINNMTPDARERLADKWIAQYDGMEGYEDVSEEVKTYRGLRDEFLIANPQAGDFKEYQKGVGRYDDEHGAGAWRTMYARKDSVFAAAMEKQRGKLKAEGKTGDVLERELDRWAMNAAAYKVVNRFRDDIYAEQMTPTVPDYGFSTGEGYTSAKKDPMEKLADEITTYQEKLATAIDAMQAAGYSVSEQDIYSMSPFYGALFSNFGVPTPSDDVMLYLRWAALNAGEDTSVDAFIAYLERLGYQQAA